MKVNWEIPPMSQRNCKLDESAIASFQAQENDAFSLAVQAYIYGYALLATQKTKYVHTHLLKPDQPTYTQLNTLWVASRLMSTKDKYSVSPNNDTLYSTAHLELAAEPVLLYVPPADRYFSWQLLDAYSNTFACISPRTQTVPQATYAIIAPRWQGPLPEGAIVIRSPTNYVWLIGRHLVFDADDVANAKALAKRSTLAPLSTYQQNAGNTYERDRHPDRLDPPWQDGGLQYFVLMSAALNRNPPPEQETVLMHLFARIGLCPGIALNVEDLDLATASGLTRAIPVAQQIIRERTKQIGSQVNGWDVLTAGIGTYGDDYLQRAAVAHKYFGANLPEESFYAIANRDYQGNPLNGANRYLLRFAPEQIPPVEAFWSLTLYRLPEYRFADNPINRYAIKDRTPGLQYADDGSLTIYIQHDPPIGQEANWLPAPTAGFYLILRAYIPKPEMLNGSYQLPSIRPVNNRN